MSRRTTSIPSAPAIPSELQARQALADYVAALLEVEGIDNKTKKLIERAKERAAKRSRPWGERMAFAQTILHAYADGHPELFEKRRKAEIYGGHKIGYHTDPPSVQLVRPTGEKKKQTWDGFVNACKRIGAHWLKLIRTVEEPDKEEVLKYHREAKERSVKEKDPVILLDAEAQLARMGVAVVQAEKFVIELNLHPETPTQAAA